MIVVLLSNTYLNMCHYLTDAVIQAITISAVNAIVFGKYIFIFRTKFLKAKPRRLLRRLDATRFPGRSFMSGITTC
jgi:hypothetical protein